jgi:microsomal dipeptidase-like Zn-dependent dipeptidase
MVKGKLVEARCRIVARLHYSEAESLCRAVFVTPGSARSGVVVAFSLGGTGAVNPDCRHHEWYQRGVRAASLTWNHANEFAGGIDSPTQGIDRPASAVPRA